MNYDELLRTFQPSDIYLAIGCANNATQQFPPFLASSPHPLCILVDPALEKAVATSDGLMAPPPICERREWNWTSAEDKRLLDTLCSYAISTRTRLIVQDYTGTDFRIYYPLDRFPAKQLLNHVLFDCTHSPEEGSCYVDFGRVSVPLRPDGTFVQPCYEPLHRLRGVLKSEHLARERAHRRDILLYLVHLRYRILCGLSEDVPWCQPDGVRAACFCLFIAYELSPDVTNTAEGLCGLFYAIVTDCYPKEAPVTNIDEEPEILRRRFPLPPLENGNE
jgi:hypothetical protein